MTFDQIIGDLKKKIYVPVYFLCGDEPYYIDQIADYIESKILSESEKEFNLQVLYGKDLDLPTLVSHAKRYPMMSNYQVVVVKEAQDLKGLIGKEVKEKKEKDQKDFFQEYLQKPMSSTILVFCYKYKALDKRTKIAKLIDQHAILFESKKIYESQLPGWIQQFILSKGYRIAPKASAMISESLGNDLSRIANEAEKLFINLKPGDEISAQMVEENIGISKEFNIFELHNALGRRNIFKANQIVNYFSANPKTNPILFTIPQLHAYFMKLLMYHALTDRSKNSVASALGVNAYFVGDYETGAKAYPVNQCIRNIGYLRDYDLRAKGVDNESTDDGPLLKELVYKILH